MYVPSLRTIALVCLLSVTMCACRYALARPEQRHQDVGHTRVAGHGNQTSDPNQQAVARAVLQTFDGKDAAAIASTGRINRHRDSTTAFDS